MKTYAFVLLMTAFVIAVGLWAVYAWTSLDAELSGHGYAAMALGVVFTVGLGVGLMALLFYSSRHGHDR